jgi:hypothetical protein
MAASQPSELHPWDAPVPGTLQRNVDQSMRLEQAARQERPAPPPSVSPVQTAHSATLIPADVSQADSLVQAPPVALAPARPQIGVPRAPRPVPAEVTVEDTVEVEAFAEFDGEDEVTGPSLEAALDLEERRLLLPRRLQMWAIGFGLAGVVIAVILAAAMTAVVVGTDLLQEIGAQSSVHTALPPLAEPRVQTERAPEPAPAAKPAARPRPKAQRPLAAPESAAPQAAPSQGTASQGTSPHEASPQGTSPEVSELPMVAAAVAGAGAVLEQLEPSAQPEVPPEELQVADLPPPDRIEADEIEVAIPAPEPPRSAPPAATLRPKMQAEAQGEAEPAGGL